MKIKLISCLALLTVASTTQANTHSVALNYGNVSPNTESVYDSISFIKLSGTYQINDRWGLELGYLNGLSSDNTICNITNAQQCFVWEKNINAITLAPQFSFYSTNKFWQLNLKAGIAQVTTDFQFDDSSSTGYVWEVDNEFNIYDNIYFGVSFGQLQGEELNGDSYVAEHISARLSYKF
jgi:hypothetical protein